MKRAVGALVLVACSAGAPGPGIDVARALGHAHELASAPRVGETAGARRAVAYIERALAETGVAGTREVVGAIDLPPIVVLGTVHRTARQTRTTDPNLVVRFGPPTGKALLVMAHYDTVVGSPGAVDNAAAVGVVLELARLLHETPPPAPVILAFTAREEAGLIGAEALAAQYGEDIGFAIALDLIGGTGELSLNGASTLIGHAEMTWIAGAATRAGVVVRAPLAHRVVSRWWPQAERSDHGPFTRRGIRAVHLYHRGHDGELIDLAYHSKRDDFARIQQTSLDEAGRLLRALVTSPVPDPDGDGFWIPQLANRVVPRWTLLGFELVLVLAALALLVRLGTQRSRGSAPGASTPAGAVLKRPAPAARTLTFGLVAGAACLAIAVAATYALERTLRGAHPAPWLHAPGLHVAAESLVLVGVLGLATRLLARLGPWIGARRYLVVAIVFPLVIGLALVALGAAELAWIWLVPAACAAAAPALGRVRLLALVPSVLPAVLVLAPAQLREAAWNGFASLGIPLIAWIGTVAIAPVAGVSWYLRDRGHSGPLGTFVLPVGWALATALGFLMLIRSGSTCSPARFHEFHLACERPSEVP